ncbi:hypothetical protein [Pseudomonas guariconensis]|uniref:hypothetical protein n=1 Tax=Pseudomonas guariconensis TaxID=1288410 RepID=UPI0018A8D727|nr:hypothetical protein [Pseudomonas guariconensis]MBF8722229.1 hypothetical protein [Pseudomonas guariconensis]
MNSSFSNYIAELKLMLPFKGILSSNEWETITKNREIVSDGELGVLISEMDQSLRQGLFTEARARALLGVLYITERIIDACEQTRIRDTTNPMEIDLAIALKLPGECSNGLAFMKRNDAVHRQDLSEDVAALLSAINSTFEACPRNLPGRRDHERVLPLRILSKAYGCLINLALKDF